VNVKYTLYNKEILHQIFLIYYTDFITDVVLDNLIREKHVTLIIKTDVI